MYFKPQTPKIILFCAILFATFTTFSQTQTYSTSGIFTVPAGVTEITVEAWGAGGSGGGCIDSKDNGGSGGTGGTYVRSVFTGLVPGTEYNISVAGPTPGSVGSNGTNGGGSWFNTPATLFANGGLGGLGGAVGNGAAITATTIGSIGTTIIAGGSTSAGGSGGGSAGGNGGNGGGSGGAATIATNNSQTTGNDGSISGGGGSGAATGGGRGGTAVAGGDGADGQVIITWSLPAPEINLVGNGINIPAGNTAISTLDDTDFGNVDVNSGSAPHTFTIENTGALDLTITSVTGGTTDFVITGSPSGTITSGNSMSFIVTFDPTTTGIKTATISISNNDTTGGENPYTFNIQGVGFDFASICGATISTFPYLEDFENTLGDWTQDGSDDFDWTNQTAGTLTTDTGPSGAASGSYYLYTEATGNTSSTANIESPCFDLSGTTNPRATFFYHMHGSTYTTGMVDGRPTRTYTNYMGDFTVDLSTDGGVTYPINLFVKNGYVQVNELSSWIPLSFDLSSYIGQTVKIRIQSVISNDSGSRSDIAIDNFSVINKANPVYAPGGITSGLSTWLKANDGHSYSEGQSVSLWQDQGKASDAKVHKTGQEPTFRDNITQNVNFNPVIEFDNPYATFNADIDYRHDQTTNSQFLTGDYGLFTQEMFIVLIPDDTPITSSFGFMDVYCGDSDLGKGEPDTTGIGFGDDYTGRINNEIIAYAHSSYNSEVAGDGYAVAEIGTGSSYTNIGIINTRNNTINTQQELYYNANNIGTNQNDVDSYTNTSDTRFWIGRSEGWYSSLNARVAEVITFSSRKDDTSERNRIESYLAIKYGITLGTNGTSLDYVASDGTLIWDVDTTVPAEDAFNYNITGIGRDDASELNQKQSKTVNTSDDITIGSTNIYATNNLNTNEFTTDKTFLVWGNNNDVLTGLGAEIVGMSAGISPSGSLTTDVEFTPMGRKWKVAAKGTTFSAKVSIPETLLIPLGPPPGDYLMFISDTPTFNPGAEYRIMSSDGAGNFQVNYSFTTTKYITFGFAPERTFERSIQFDGVQGYLDAGDVLDINTPTTAFTISAWVKRENTSSSIVSKRDNGFTTGYNFGINASGNIEMSWKNGSTQIITSSVPIPVSKWHHIAIIYNGTNAKLYIDGVEDTTQTLSAPTSNSESFLIAAADGANTTSFFEGNIDEVRIWDVALTEDQLRFVMNQEIEDNTNVEGSYFTSLGVSPAKNDIASIPWANLKGYYPMSTYTYTNCKDASGNENTAALKNLTTVDYQTAPLPYKSAINGAWDTPTTWLNNTEQNLPNSLSIVDGVTPIDWNIVEISDNNVLTSGSRDTKLLGLNIISTTADAVDTKLTIDGDNATGTGNGLTVTHYLKLDGVLDLQGESQLIQTIGSDLDAASIGNIEKDQQGEFNRYRYNYWSSPVMRQGAGNASSTIDGDPTAGTSFSIADVLRDGTNPNSPITLNFTNGYDGSLGTPITLSTAWMYKYANHLEGTYSAWEHIGSTGGLYAGEGFIMKGAGDPDEPETAQQNYVFEGKPNNGAITLTVAPTYSYLVGNPYPSALDANQFLLDNNPDGRNSIRGEIYFWEHYGGDSHNLRDYQGGYATYNFSGGAPASAQADVNQAAPSSPKIPGQYIAVGQSFYVVGEPGGIIEFNNGQRTLEKEATGVSVFMKSSTTKSKIVTVNKIDLRPKFRIGFESSQIDHRQLLLTIDEKATDNVDWGYDSEIYNIVNDDMYWMIDAKKYVIQGTNTLTLEKEIPLGIETKEGGNVRIMVDALENVDENTKIYIKDKLTGETYDITNQAFEINLEAGEYQDRFVLAFQPRLKTLQEVALVEGVHIFMNNTISELQINRIVATEIMNVSLFNYLGQQVKTWNINSNERFISLPAQMSTGVYIAQVQTTEGIITKKIIIE